MLPMHGREEKSERTSSNLNVLPHWKFMIIKGMSQLRTENIRIRRRRKCTVY